MDQGIESVYNLIPQEYIKPKKQPRYQSKFKAAAKIDAKEGKTAKKSLGPAKLPVESPDKFLKKGTGAPRLPTPKKFTYPNADKLKPEIPKDKPLHGIQSNKNFVNTNAVENIMSVARKPVPQYVDSPKGSTHKLEPSGLVPKYRNREDYGEVPEYIKQRNAEVKQAQKEYDEYVRERMRQGAMQQLKDGERAGMIEGLKKNWEELQHEYLSLSVVTDTISKRYRKERIETEMRQLERDIDLIERHKVIYISNY